MAVGPITKALSSSSITDIDPILQTVSDAYLLVDSQGVIRRSNPVAVLLLGEDTLQGQWLGSFFTSALDWQNLATGSQCSLQLKKNSDHTARLKVVAEASEGARHCLLTMENAEQRFREQLLRQSSLMHLTLCSIADAVISVDRAGMVKTLNPMARELLQLNGGDGIGSPIEQLFVIADPNNQRLISSPVKDVLEQGKTALPAIEALLYAVGRKPTLINVQVVPCRDSLNQVDGCLLVFRDTSQAGRENHRLNWQARHDALTALPNRQSFETEISQAVSAAKARQATFGLLYIDIYQFKVINDSCGHGGGDELLRQLSELMSSKLRNQDLLARLGSDEFAVLLRNCTLAGAQRVADILLSAVQAFQFQWNLRDIKVGISIGVLVIDHDAESEGQILATANAACCAAKELGRNRIHLYNKDREVEQRRNEINWVVQINDALTENRLCLYEQTIAALSVDASAQGVEHSEILLRMKDPDGLLIGPAEFIPAAERFGLMDDVDRWVINAVIEHMCRRKDNALEEKIYSVNLSGVSLGDPSLADFVIERIERTGIDASLLHFEITETAAIRHLDSAVEFMQRLKVLGSCFYLDDFGSGLSSFGYLKDLPVDYLKIDGSFVRTMLDDSNSLAMVSTINHLAHSMGLKTVAEYVESDELKEKLADVGVDFIQGFGVARPKPLTDR
ncbi:MAG: response regulator receiver protein [Cellvibrionaceae bacterium]|nr:response regulator receiver protein [Cellvibrionaceae bacterium]|tara:strand:- start:19692 stop:21728 length:2037 start_codon:yes stop_codon:yes gene_type:complete